MMPCDSLCMGPWIYASCCYNSSSIANDCITNYLVRLMCPFKRYQCVLSMIASCSTNSCFLTAPALSEFKIHGCIDEVLVIVH